MFTQVFLLFFLLSFLFILSQKITSHIFTFLYWLTKSESLSLWFFVLLFLPGTIIHELSHFLLATILRVPTGELSILPAIEKKGEEREIKTGKLTIGKTDPFRLSIIGLAPLIVGFVIIYLIGKTFLPDISYILNTKYLILNTLCFYLLFAISTTMFSSKKDLESLMIALPIVLLLFLSLYIIGVRIFLENTLIDKITKILSDLNFYLLITGVLDFIVYLFLATNLTFWRKILRFKSS